MVNSESQPSSYEALESLPQCPVCHREDGIEKASSVVRRNSGQAFIGDGVVSYRFTSTIASEFAKPPPPAAPTWADTAFRMFLSIAIAGIVGLAYYIATEIGNVTMPGIAEIALIAAGVWFGLLVPAKMAIETGFRRRTAQGSIPAWREASARWDNLYYCARDDVGFVKGSKEWRTPERVRELLYDQSRLTAAPSRSQRADATVS